MDVKSRPIPGMMGIPQILLLSLFVSISANAGQSWPVAVRSECEVIASNVTGAEDLAWLDQTALIVSATDRRHGKATNGLCLINTGPGSGDCSFLQYEDGTVRPQAPHGIFAPGYPSSSVVVIDHPPEAPSLILQYSRHGNVLRQAKSPIELEGINPNDIVVDPLGRFFFSDPPGENTSTWKWLSTLLGFSRSGIYVLASDSDGSDLSTDDKICRRLRYPNGVALDQQNRLYLADTMGGRLYILDQVQTSSLEQRCWTVASIKGGDNINLSNTESFKGLVVTGHPKLLSYIQHMKSEDNCSPTTVHAVSEGGTQTSKILILDGKQKFRDSQNKDATHSFCAGSSAILTDNFLYVGQVFGPGILRCPVFYRSVNSD